MSIFKIISEKQNIAIFCRNHRKYLESAVKINTELPDKPITFRAKATWKSAVVALNVHGRIKIYFAPIGGDGNVEYEAQVSKVLLYPNMYSDETKELLKYCLPETRDENLWDNKVNTLYVISHTRKIPSPFPYCNLLKLSDGKNISDDYGYSYAFVYEYNVY